MKKNRVKNPAQNLADIVLDGRSPAYKELCLFGSDENGLPSNKPAARLRSEIRSVLTDLLKGNFDAVNQKIAQHTMKVPPLIAVSPTRRGVTSGDFYSTVKQVRIGETDAYLETTLPNSATPEQVVYGLLLRALESGDIHHLTLCQRCGNIFYRKSKGKFCRDECRWNYNNHSPERKQRYLKGKWYPFPKKTKLQKPKPRP